MSRSMPRIWAQLIACLKTGSPRVMRRKRSTDTCSHPSKPYSINVVLHPLNPIKQGSRSTPALGRSQFCSTRGCNSNNNKERSPLWRGVECPLPLRRREPWSDARIRVHPTSKIKRWFRSRRPAVTGGILGPCCKEGTHMPSSRSPSSSQANRRA